VFNGKQLEARIEALERNLVEAIVRAESAEAVALALFMRGLEQRFEQRKSAMAYMRSMQAELFQRIRAIRPDHLSDRVAEYLGPMLQPYWQAAAEYDRENGLPVQQEKAQ